MIATAGSDGVRNVDQVVPVSPRGNSGKQKPPPERERRDPKDERETDAPAPDDPDSTPRHIDVRV